MNMNKKSQTLIWREKNKTAQSRSNGFGLLGCLALTSTPGQETFISNSRNDDSKQSPCFFKRNAQSEGPRLVVTWRQAAIIPHLKCRVFKMCLTGKLLMGVTHHIASTKPRSVHQQYPSFQQTSIRPMVRQSRFSCWLASFDGSGFLFIDFCLKSSGFLSSIWKAYQMKSDQRDYWTPTQTHREMDKLRIQHLQKLVRLDLNNSSHSLNFQ